MAQQERRSGKGRRIKKAETVHKDQTVGRRESDILDAVAPRQREFTPQADNQSRRNRVYEVMEVGRKDDFPSLFFDVFIIALISLNVLAVILESVASLQQVYGDYFYGFELFSVAVFTIELALRIWTVSENPDPKFAHPVWGRLKYLLTPTALVDIIAILPFYLSFLIAVDLRFMRVLRLLRVFKLTRYSSAMSIMLTVLRQEARAFGAALFVLLLLMIFAASMIFLFEHEAQPDVFSNIPNAMWWAVITLTTVGFGDAYPITPVGKFFGAAISIVGIGMVALPAGILASAFSEQLHLRREKYRDRVVDALADGVLTEEEAEQLRKIQEDLGISIEEARNILHHSVKGGLHFYAHCPHCGESLQDDHRHKR
ncbi:ion transporter [Terasakiella sp. A23]|uniref:ion transporter n=1 Tax=Terasakiella sp. FCG-A23 TaxID=3080561 RepID=UPI002953FBA0|nr:ion transporter [Terasakiella sp. A23]MDV7338114.1 ion transporter [Terasakiella sp. A23]